jgi:hypothetical protein
MDLFLAGSHGDVHWTRLTRTAVTTRALLAELTDTDPLQLVPSTLLAALYPGRPSACVGPLCAHRRYDHKLKPYDAWPIMERLGATESEFLGDVRGLEDGRLAAILDALPTFVRAWPVCLRQCAMEHVQRAVKGLQMLPLCPQISEPSQDVAGWLWSVADRGEDSPEWGASLAVGRAFDDGRAPVRGPPP